MLSNIQQNIIVRAIKIRLEKGEDLGIILDSYVKLTEKDKENLKDKITNIN